MGYRIINVTPEFRAQFEERAGLEGPFFYDGNRVLYYDPKQGQYYDPRTDFYVSNEEMDAEHGILVQRLVDYQK